MDLIFKLILWLMVHFGWLVFVFVNSCVYYAGFGQRMASFKAGGAATAVVFASPRAGIGGGVVKTQTLATQGYISF